MSLAYGMQKTAKQAVIKPKKVYELKNLSLEREI